MTKREVFCYSTAIWQKATTAFDGSLPAGDAPLVDRSIYRYAAAAAGGLICWNHSEPIVIPVILVTLDASGTIDLYQVNLDDAGAPVSGEALHLESFTGVTRMRLTEYEIILLPKQGLKLVTNQPGIALAYASLERTFYH